MKSALKTPAYRHAPTKDKGSTSSLPTKVANAITSSSSSSTTPAALATTGGSPSGTTIAAKAAEVGQTYNDNGVTYEMGGSYSTTNNTSDCSHYVHDVISQSGSTAPYVTTSSILTSPDYTEVTANPQPGDIIVQDHHMGVYTGMNASSQPQGWQMGNHGAAVGTWGPGGWFTGGNPRYFRPNQ